MLELGGWAGPGVGLVSSIESDPSSKSMPKPRLPWPQWASCLSNTPPRHTRHTPVGRQPPHRDEVTRTRDTWHVSWQVVAWLIVTGTSMPVEFRNCLTHVKNFREMSTQLIFILTNASMFSRTIHLNISTESLHLHRIFMFWWNSKWFSAFCFKLIELLKYEYLHDGSIHLWVGAATAVSGVCFLSLFTKSDGNTNAHVGGRCLEMCYIWTNEFMFDI